jgi:hypothetical protein
MQLGEDFTLCVNPQSWMDQPSRVFVFAAIGIPGERFLLAGMIQGVIFREK